MNSYTVLADFYDKFNAHVDYAAIRDFIRSVLNEHKIPQSASLLDLACGTGRLTNLFAADGYDMIGVDLSPDMLSHAREESEALGLSPLYLCQDMRELDLYGTVDAAFSCLDSLNYLSSCEELARVFAHLKNFIVPGGLFLFDVNTRYKFEHIYGQNTYVYDEKNVYCVWQNFFHEKKNTCDFLLTFFVKEGKSWRRLEESQRETFFSDEDLERAYKKSGFEAVAIYGDLQKNAPSPTDEKRYFVLRRSLS